MGYIEIFITLIYLLLSVSKIYKKSRLLSLLILSYFGLYIVVLPLFYLSGMEFVSVMPDRSFINEVLFSNLLFVFVFFIVTLIVSQKNIIEQSSIGSLIKKYDIERISGKKIIVPFVVFFLITYLMKAYIYNDYLYFISDVNPFETTQQFKTGGWFFLVVSSAFTYIGYMLLYRISFVRKNILAFFALVLLLYFLSVFLKFAERTVILVMVIAFIIFRTEYIGLWKKNKIFSFRSLLLAIFIILFLTYYDAIRQNNSIVFSFDVFDISKQIINFLQVENSILLAEYFSNSDFLGLQYLLLVMSGYSLLPTFLLPFDKINTGVEAILTKMIFGGNLNPIFYSPNSTITFTIPMTGYAEFGYVGVVIHSFIYSIILLTLIYSYKRNTFLSFMILILSITSVLGFRLSVESIIIGVQVSAFFYLFLVFLYKIKIK
ncbi:O-antigen polymerase [Geobacillus stearothermophilus]|uniref:O-antigen polymerase n=1 Tax=Geobacillus stearothermophilus TaxID=1422 RepID=UPI002E214F01|nr:O-antigen ligase [Geobacillus stearothermophilus]MED4830814.1 O-antigen ligase [Geobacillus stearothermophilus]MED4959976.1 O-antigen ligase [Geobacillus stearothermophilus]